MLRHFSILLMLVVFSVAGLAQTSTPDPSPKPVYKTYATAMSAGKKLIADSRKADATDAFQQGAKLAKNDVRRADALIEAAKVQKDDYHIGSTSGKFKAAKFTVYHHPNAVQSLNEALELQGIDDAKRAEIKILRADVYFAASKAIDAHNQLAAEVEKQFGKAIHLVIRDEMTALAAAPSTPPDLKAKALMQNARTYKNFRDRYTTAEDLRSGYQALKDAAEMVGTQDSTKADALLRIAEIARLANDSNIFATAYEAVTKLPKAGATQKFTAYSQLANVLIANDRLAGARELLADALKVAGLSTSENTGIHRLLAFSFVTEIVKAKPAKSTEDKLMESARVEFEKAANESKLSGDGLAEFYASNAEYIRKFSNPVHFRLAHGQLKAAFTVRNLTDKGKALVQYEVGETFRLEMKYPEARAAYLLVTKANPQYHNYAQQRIKEVDAVVRQNAN